MATAKKPAMNFSSVSRTTLHTSRNGKHKTIVTQVLSDVGRLKDGDAIKIPIAQLASSKAKVRSALNRAGRKLGRAIKTSSDETYLYVWMD